jgi:hypothetical protein
MTRNSIPLPVHSPKRLLGIVLWAAVLVACSGSDPVAQKTPPADPEIVGVNPAAVIAGSPAVELHVLGAHFDDQAVVEFSGLAKPTTFVSEAELQITLTAQDLEDPGNRDVRVKNGSNAVSNVAQLLIASPVPQITSVLSIQNATGSQSVNLRVFGQNLLRSSVVQFNGSALATQKISGTELQATLPAASFANAAVYQVTVQNPPSPGGVSNSIAFEIVSQPLTLTGLHSLGATASGGGYFLSVYGTGFTPFSVARRNGTDRPTTYLNGHHLDVEIPPADVGSVGTMSITVNTPGPSGGTSNSKDIAVRVPGSASVTSIQALDIPATFLVYDKFSNRFYASIPDTAAANASTVVAIDPATGAIVGSVALGKDPGVMALSSDGTALWVSIDGAGQIRRVDLPSLTPSTTIAFAGMRAEEIKVKPGQPGAVAVEKRILGVTTGSGTVMFVDGNQLPSAPQAFHSNTTFAFNETGTLLYGFNGLSSEFGFHTLEVRSDGLAEVSSASGLLEAYNIRLEYTAGRVYTTNGVVIDAERHLAIGAVSLPLPLFEMGVYPDAELGRIFWLTSNQLNVFDMNTLNRLAVVTLPVTVFQEHPSVDMLRLVRWGTDGLAFRDGKRIFIFRTPLASP